MSVPNAKTLRRAAVAVAVAGLAYGCLLLLLSLSGGPDTPCGSVLDRNFIWSSAVDNSCSVTYTAAAANTLGMLVIAAVLIGRRTASSAPKVLLAAAAVGVVALLGLALKVASYSEPVMRRGWVSARNVTAVTTLVLIVFAGLLATLRNRWTGQSPAQ